jgi:MFS family permease
VGCSRSCMFSFWGGEHGLNFSLYQQKLLGTVIFCMNSATTNAVLIACSVVFGFVSGTIISGASASFSLCPKDPRDFGTYIGTGMSIWAAGLMIGPLISGAFVDRYREFFEGLMFSSAMCLMGSFVALGTKGTTPQGILGRV